MKINKIFFSPTGSTKKVADIMCGFLSDNVAETDLSSSDYDFDSIVFNEEDICIFAVPSFGGRVPKTAVERIKKLKGNNNRSVLVVTYGNRHYDDTFIELKDVVMECGFKPFAGVASVCRHSIMTDIAKNRPDKFDIEELREFSEIIKRHIDSNNTEVADMPGNRPYRDFGGVPFKPFADEKCISCGKCAKFCPVKAIPLDNPSETVNDLCITCMRCVSICPVSARSLGEGLKIMTEKFAPMLSGRKENRLFID